MSCFIGIIAICRGAECDATQLYDVPREICGSTWRNESVVLRMIPVCEQNIVLWHVSELE